MNAKSIYHRIVPYALRAPFGLARRGVADRLRRIAARGSIPPRELLAVTQSTPTAAEYIAVGRRAARSVETAFISAGLPPQARVLDFGSGPARVTRHLARTAWRIDAVDHDARVAAWISRALPAIRVQAIDASPPLPFPNASFDAIYAATAFVHLKGRDRAAWIEELARVLAPHGLLAIGLMPAVTAALREFAAPFELLFWSERGLDGFLDLALFRRRSV